VSYLCAFGDSFPRELFLPHFPSPRPARKGVGLRTPKAGMTSATEPFPRPRLRAVHVGCRRSLRQSAADAITDYKSQEPPGALEDYKSQRPQGTRGRCPCRARGLRASWSPWKDPAQCLHPDNVGRLTLEVKGIGVAWCGLSSSERCWVPGWPGGFGVVAAAGLRRQLFRAWAASPSLSSLRTWQLGWSLLHASRWFLQGKVVRVPPCPPPAGDWRGAGAVSSRNGGLEEGLRASTPAEARE
jgi:hypothetical protein